MLKPSSRIHLLPLCLLGALGSAQAAAPTASPVNASTIEDTAVPLTLLGTDTDGDTLSYIIARAPRNGNVVISGNTATYTPNPDYAGADSFTYVAKDASKASATAVASLTITPVNDAPTVAAVSSRLNEDSPKTFTLRGNDPERSALTFAITQQPQHGTVTLSGSSATYTPAANYQGSDSFSYTATDPDGATSNTAAYTLIITPVNDRPQASSQSASLAQNTPHALTLDGSDPDGDTLTWYITQQPQHGAVTLSGNVATYTPKPGYHGSDSFRYLAKDASLSSAVATASLTISATNAAPSVTDLSATLTEDTPKAITLVGTDPEGSKLSYVIASQPTHGSATLSGNVITYTPTGNYTGTDSLSYTATDGTLTSPVGNISLTITPVNDPPQAAASSHTLPSNTASTLTLSGLDSDGDSLSYHPITQPAHGTLSPVDANGTLTYTPLASYTGSDHFLFRVKDSGGLTSKEAKISLTVSANHAPQANAGVDLEATEGQGVTLNGSASTDPDGDTLSYQWAQTDSSGLNITLTGANTASASFTAPAVNANTPLTFTLTVNDGKGGGTTDTITITVKGKPVVLPSLTGKLNDTGITLCGTASTNTTCPQAGFLAQDAEIGRDATQATNNDADGHRGFSYTKLDAKGKALTDQTVNYATTPWACVKDNVTGLIWEVKTDDGGLHDKDWTYTWYNTDSSKNGGMVGTAAGGSCGSTSPCDTQSYVQAVNTAGWCGATTGWRMPSVTELQSITDISRNSPAIDTAYFPNTMANWYWSGTPYENYVTYAWDVYFNDGVDSWSYRNDVDAVRLVRSGQGD